MYKQIQPNYPQFILNRYQDVGKKPAHTDTPEKKGIQHSLLSTTKTRCVCETLMPPKHPSFEKHDPDI